MINLLNRSVRNAEKMIKVIRYKENELWNEYKDMVDEYGAGSTFAIEKRIIWGTVHNIMIESGIKLKESRDIDKEGLTRNNHLNKLKEELVNGKCKNIVG